MWEIDSGKPARALKRAQGCPVASRAAKRASGLAAPPPASVLEAAARPSPPVFYSYLTRTISEWLQLEHQNVRLS
jgi:hypothetical protein